MLSTTVKPEALAAHPVLGALSPDERQTLMASSVVCEYHGGRTISANRESMVVFLLEGCARALQPAQPHQLVRVVRAPAVFGDAEALTGEPAAEVAESLGPVVVLRVPRALFLAWVAQSGSFARAAMTSISARACETLRQRQAIASSELNVSVDGLLRLYAAVLPLDAKGVRVTHEDLARDLGVSRRSIVRTMTALRERWRVSFLSPPSRKDWQAELDNPVPAERDRAPTETRRW